MLNNNMPCKGSNLPSAKRKGSGKASHSSLALAGAVHRQTPAISANRRLGRLRRETLTSRPARGSEEAAGEQAAVWSKASMSRQQKALQQQRLVQACSLWTPIRYVLAGL
jgi:hypothetical protein